LIQLACAHVLLELAVSGRVQERACIDKTPPDGKNRGGSLHEG
jgi:hypothetical protein